MNEKRRFRPYGAVHILARRDISTDKITILGCSFRVWGEFQFITANHCIESIQEEELVLLDLLEDDPLKDNISVIRIDRHHSADLAVITTVERDLSEYHKFSIAKIDLSLGAPLHSFGYVSGMKGNSFRVVPAFSMRDFDFEDIKYRYHAIELSMPIPKGTSGAPVFSARSPNPLVGVATGSVFSEIELRNMIAYQDERITERERISEFTRYGIVLDIHSVLGWLKEHIPGEPIFE